MITNFPLASIVNPTWPKQIYTGREEGCRCGCHGNYFDEGTVGFARARNKAFKINPTVFLCETDGEVNRKGREILDAVKEDGKPRAYARATNGKIVWIDIVLDGRYPYLNTITIYPDK